MYLSPWITLCKETGESIITSFYTVNLYLLCGIGFWAALVLLVRFQQDVLIIVD